RWPIAFLEFDFRHAWLLLSSHDQPEEFPPEWRLYSGPNKSRHRGWTLSFCRTLATWPAFQDRLVPARFFSLGRHQLAYLLGGDPLEFVRQRRPIVRLVEEVCRVAILGPVAAPIDPCRPRTLGRKGGERRQAAALVDRRLGTGRRQPGDEDRR